jgi:diguanylate cyclase (GGDEF)-like protein
VSFRNRLALFFVLIVIVPMLAVTFLLFRLIAQSENGKSNAAIQAQHDVARQFYAEQRVAAQKAIDTKVGNDAIFSASLERGDHERAAKRARQLVKFQGIARILVVRDGRVIVRAGSDRAIAPAIRPVRSSSNRPLGNLEVSVIDAPSYARRVKELTGLDTVVRNGRAVMASTLPALGGRDVPRDGGEIRIGGRDLRAVSFIDPGAFPGQHLRVSTLREIGSTSANIRDGRITAASILVGFFLIAIACAVLVSRMLQEQIAGFLAAARQVAAGNFKAKVKITGNDEFAELGNEFNKMSKELERRLGESLTDELTQLPNRRALDQALADEIERYKRSGAELGLVLLDLDKFKQINDEYGHPQGDLVLQEVAKVLAATSREIDHPARYGGEEFAVVVPGTDLEGTYVFAERVRDTMQALCIPRVDGRGTLSVTASFGVATLPESAADGAALIKAADDALFEAKRTGRNKTVRAR